MSAAPGRRRPDATALGLGVAGAALLGLAVLLTRGGALGSLRTVVAVAAVLVVPGWLLGRLVDEDGDAIGRLVGGVVATLAVLAGTGFVAAAWGLRVAEAAVCVPLLVVVAAAALLGAFGPRPARAPLAPLAVSLALGLAALVGAWGTHLALPATPIEPAFSLEAAHAVVTGGDVVVRVQVTRVRTAHPTQLTLTVDGQREGSVVVPQTAASVTLRAGVGSGHACASLRVLVTAPNGAFLSPPVRCAGR